MNRKASFTCLPLILLLLSPACESKLYPPTDPPALSNIVITSDSYRNATTTVREGDIVFISVDVSDPEDDPETLSLSVLSGVSEVMSNEVSSSRIFDRTTWKTWFDTAGLSTGGYDLSLMAVDKEGNESDTISSSFDITSDITATVAPGDISVALDAAEAPEYWVEKNGATGEPFHVNFNVTNNFSLPMDIVKIPINIEDSSNAVQHSGIAVVTSIDPAEAKAGQLRLHVPDITNPDITGGEAVVDTANIEIVIY